MEQAAVRGVRIADRLVQTAMDIVFILILLIGLCFLADTIYVFYHARADVVMPLKPVDGDMAPLKAVAEDAIAWITLDDTSVDYPIMQGEDNMEYLNKDPYGEYSLAGAIFLDSRNASDFSDEYSVVYGHHMSGGYMFGALDEFIDAEYFGSHTTGTLTTDDGELPVTVRAFMYTDARDEMIFDPEADHSGLREYIRQNADHFRDIPPGERIVALTTCKSPTSTRRMILFLTIDEN